MGYFDGLTAAAFKINQAGQTVFHPWGIFGRGRVMRDAAHADQVPRFLRRYYQLSLFSLIVLGVIGNIALLLAAAVLMTAWFFIGSRPLLAGTSYSEEKLTFKEALGNSAAKHSEWMLWLFLAISALVSAGALWLLLAKAKTLSLALASGSLILVFGACAWIFGKMLASKRRKT